MSRYLMSRYGSSGSHLFARATTEEYLTLRVSDLRRKGVLGGRWDGTWGWSLDGRTIASVAFECEPDAVTLSYRSGADEEVDERVEITRTPCHYGGSRPWFVCPGCERRAGVLHLRGGRFRCRHCHRLAYRSTRESPLDRAFRRAERLRERLGCPPGVANPHGPKPRGMHRTTYLRLSSELERATHEVFRLIGKELGLASDSVPEQ